MYELTHQCSAASAIAAGAMGELAQYNAVVCRSPDGGPWPDDYRGLITATAIPWDPDPREYAQCSGCTSPDDFGPGRLDLAAAEGLLYDIWGGSDGENPPGGEITALFRMKLSATDIARSLVGTTDYGDSGHPPILRVYEYDVPVIIPTVREGESERYAWPLPVNSVVDYAGDMGECHTTCPLVYGQFWTPANRNSVWELATDPSHPTSCTMGVIDQATGVTHMRCYNLARVTRDEQGHESVEYAVAPSELQMAYTVFSYRDLTGVTVHEDRGSGWGVRFANPVSTPARFSYEVPSRAAVRVALYDVTGRTVALFSDGPVDAGVHEVRWDGRNGSGQKVSPGIYWLALHSQGRKTSARLVVLR